MSSDPDGRIVWRYALIIGLVVRLVILWHTSTLSTQIVDEQQYRQIADNLLAGNGFAWGPGELTSIRPPLYPALLAGVWRVTGADNLQAIRILQILLGLATSGLVYLLGARLYSPRVGRYAAAICWLYPSFVFFDFLILTETLFTFLLVAFVLATVALVQSARAPVALVCGVTLGLAALTRSVLWPVPLLLYPLLVLLLDVPTTRRLALSALVLVGYVVVIAPWAVRNTRLQHVLTVVDTMGGINLRMGNYEYTPDDRMWDAVSLTGEKSWVYGLSAEHPGPITEGEKEKWAQAKAIAYMRANPMVTLRRSWIKFADFWGLEREFIAGVQSGLFAPPAWFKVLGSVLIVGGYVLVVVAGAAGMWLAPPRDWRMQVLLLLPIVLLVGAHSIVFGHSRYHLPLMPLLGLYAAQLVSLRLPALRLAPTRTSLAAVATVVLLLAIWVRQVVLVDLARIGALLHRVG